MKPFILRSAEEQLTIHLRDEILKGQFGGEMPGVLQLAEKLKTSPRTVTAAVERLKREGFLRGRGHGRRCRIVVPKNRRPPGLEIEIFHYDDTDLTMPSIVEAQHRLQEAGHIVTNSKKYLMQLDMDVASVAKYVRKRKAQAWLLVCGSLPVLKWFASGPIPALALFGRQREVDMAGVQPQKLPALEIIVRRLVELGHRRIVHLAREQKRLPKPGFFEQKFLDLLEEHGIRPGPYNLPDWQVNPDGLCNCLNELFKHTPPTALIFDEPHLFTAARFHLGQRGIISPRDVSIISLEPDPLYEWCRPKVSHAYWDANAMVRRILEWADNTARGKEDKRKTFFKTDFIEGGTIGPVSRRIAGWG